MYLEGESESCRECYCTGDDISSSQLGWYIIIPAISSQLANPYGTYMGPISTSIWAPYGLPTWDPYGFCKRDWYGSHMGIWYGTNMGPTWIPHGSHMGFANGIDMGIWYGTHMGPRLVLQMGLVIIGMELPLPELVKHNWPQLCSQWNTVF